MSIRNRVYKKAASKAADKLVESDLVPAAAVEGVSKAMVDAVDKAVTARWARALDRAAATSGTIDERVAEVTDSFRRELVGAGAAAGAVAASPGIGTMAAIGTLGAEIGWFVMRAADLIMTTAVIHGRTEATVEERRSWVLAILAFGEDAAKEFGALAERMHVGPVSGKGLQVPLEVLERVNANIGANLLSKFGSRRGAIAVGRVLPFGVGAVIGGGANYAMVKSLSRNADNFFLASPLQVTMQRLDDPTLPPPPKPTSARGPGKERTRPFWSRGPKMP